MEFKPNIPIYIQIMDQIKKELINAVLAPGDKVASVRELALLYGVNPNTVQRALAQLEQEMILYSERTSGRFISKDETVIQNMKLEYVNSQMDSFIGELRELGIKDEDIIAGIKRRLQDGKSS